MQLGQGILIAGRYVVERKIGEGSWGEVWLGHHAAVGMRVAIKTLLPAKAASHDAIVRFKREAKFLGRIQSDYVARVLDFLDDQVYGLILVMEMVDGESLGDLLMPGTLSVERSLEIGIDLVSGLCDLHDARVVHRDMKPANVILRPLPDGRTRAVIIDFSLGRLMGRVGEDESSLTQLTGTAMSVGTLPYMSPEQVLDSRKVTVASDVYALGAILYRCVRGEYVFTDGSDAIIARRKLTMEAPRLDTGRADATAQGFERIVARALRKRPEERYESAQAMLAELLSLSPEKAVANAPAPPRGRALESAESREPTDKRESSMSRASSVHQAAPPERSPLLLALAGAGLLAAGLVFGLSIGHARWSRPASAPITVQAQAQAPDVLADAGAAIVITDESADAAVEATLDDTPDDAGAVAAIEAASTPPSFAPSLGTGAIAAAPTASVGPAASVAPSVAPLAIVTASAPPAISAPTASSVPVATTSSAVPPTPPTTRPSSTAGLRP